MNPITGDATVRGVSVVVHPGGALADLTLTRAALALGADTLASTVIAAVTKATATADRRTRQALTLAGLDTTALGPPPAEEEPTVPETWRVS